MFLLYFSSPFSLSPFHLLPFSLTLFHLSRFSLSLLCLHCLVSFFLALLWSHFPSSLFSQYLLVPRSFLQLPSLSSVSIFSLYLSSLSSSIFSLSSCLLICPLFISLCSSCLISLCYVSSRPSLSLYLLSLLIFLSQSLFSVSSQLYLLSSRSLRF